MNVNVRFLSIVSFLAVVSLPVSGFAAAPKSQLAEHVPGEYVVKLRVGRLASLAAIRAQQNRFARSLSHFQNSSAEPLRTDGRYMKVKVTSKSSTKSVLRILNNMDSVEYAEPNFIYRASAPIKMFPGWDGDWGGGASGRTPNDPSFNQLWGMLNVGQADPSGQVGIAGIDIDATLAWEHGTGSRDVVVAVIDTGIDYTHEDLAENMWVNPGEIAGNGVDDDGNGFIDDVHGWSFAGDKADPMDDNRHGTHCAGTIGAKGDNGIGVAGVSWNVSLMPIKFLTAEGSGSLADAVESIKYATKMHANVMSNSWGGGGYSRAMEDAIKEARDAGILFVAAAGNESNNNDLRPTYPATYQVDNVMAVAASDNKDSMASWSNHGGRTVHLAAPGVRIYSTTPGNRYESLSGTSMACPHVAGAAALLWSLNRTMNYREIKDRLIQTTDAVRAFRTRTIAGGRLNINNAILNRIPERVAPPEDGWMAHDYALESAHDYADNMNETFAVRVEGARFIRVKFARIGMEEGYDFLRILDAEGNEMDAVTGEVIDYTTQYVDGDTLYINMVTDGSITGWGFQVVSVEYVL